MTTLPFGEVAPIQRRVVAYILDALIASVIPIVGTVVAIVLVTGAAASSDPLAGMAAVMVLIPIIALLEIAWLVVYTLMQSGAGSIGMRAQGLRLASAQDGTGIGFWRALLRNVVFGLAGSIVVGYFSPLFDGSGRFQGWHDKASGAVMLDARISAPAAPTSAMPVASPGASFPPPAPAAPMYPAGAPSLVVPPRPPMPPAMPPRPAPPAPVGQPAPAPAAPEVPADLPDQTVISPRRTDALPDDPLISFVPGVTQQPPAPSAPVAPAAPEPTAEPAAPATPEPAPTADPALAPAAPAPAAPAPASGAPSAPLTSAPAGGDDDIESTRISIPGHRLVFTWDDGQRSSVSGRTVFGRNPDPEPGAVVVAVRDETLSLSKTHFEAGAEPTGGWVMDRQSTNGTVVVRDGVRIACPPGQRIPVRLGDAIEIGDRIVTIGGFA